MATDYATFLEQRRHSKRPDGIDLDSVGAMPHLFDFQRELTQWALHQGRAALFADTGLGKTPMELTWADHIVRHTGGGNVLILTPLAVSYQFVREAEKFGFEVHRSHDGSVGRGITVTNYEQLHKFDPSDFVALACDESGILKNFHGTTRSAITAFMRKMPYRLLASATPAPNDYTELGTSSEALGYLGHMDMLSRFFVNNKNNMGTRRAYREMAQWRFKGHAEIPFWRWVASWARAIRKPSDLGYDDEGFILPELRERQHVVEERTPPPGQLFTMEALSLYEQRQERKRTQSERCGLVADLVDHDAPALVWCQYNAEGDLLERIIPDGVQVSGADSDESKEEKLLAFSDGQIRVLITKPQIAGWGMNWQHCNHMTFFPSHSFEQYYQGVRRCWRFGQKRPVTVDIVTTPGERRVLENLQSKAAAADKMFDQLVELMNEGLRVEREDGFTQREELPAWLLPSN